MEDYSKIEIQKLETSSKEDCYLLSCNGIYYEANDAIVELIKALQFHDSKEKAISFYLKEKQGKYTKEQITQLVDNYISHILSKTTTLSNKTFIYQKELLPASAIDRFSNTCSFIFQRPFMLIITIVTLLLDIYFFFSTNNLFQLNEQIGIYGITGLLIFIVVSSFFHELGHASACKYYGLKHGGIGFALYLNFPVLYTNVTEIWKLNRKRRCIVNLAGVYFQCILLSALIIIHLITNNGIVKYMALIMNLNFLITLNPFFKFDGYWIVSDVLGVPNLRERSKELLIYFYRRIRKQPIVGTPYLMQANKAEKYCLLAYSILVNLFMAFYFFYIIPRFLYSFMQSFPGQIEDLILYLSNRVSPPFALIHNIGAQLLSLALILYVLFNLIRSFQYGRTK